MTRNNSARNLHLSCMAIYARRDTVVQTPTQLRDVLEEFADFLCGESVKPRLTFSFAEHRLFSALMLADLF